MKIFNIFSEKLNYFISSFLELFIKDENYNNRKFSFFENLLRLELFIELLLLKFFLRTKFGIFIFFSSCFFTYYYYDPSLPRFIGYISILIFSNVFASSFLIFILLQFDISRDYIYYLIDKNFILSIVGNPGSKTALTTSTVAVAALIIAIVSESLN